MTHPEPRLSEAIRLATQTPYEAGYRDGLAHGQEVRQELLAAAKAVLGALTKTHPYLEYQTVRQLINTEVAIRLKAAIEQAEEGAPRPG